MADGTSPLGSTPLLRQVGHLLRPLVRLLIRRGITFPILADLLRSVYVEVAARDLLAPHQRTDSRLTLLTGIHRKEIRRLREAGVVGVEIPEAVSLASQVIARWLAGHSGPEGAPAPLDRAAFETLVRGITTDIRPRAVLDDLLAQGVLTQQPDGALLLNQAAYLPQSGSAAQLHYFGRNLHDHLAAASANVLADKPPFLERAVHYDRLSQEAAEALETLGRDAAQKLLLDVNRAAQALVDREPAEGVTDGRKTRRVNLGIYLYNEPDPEPDEQGSGETA